MPSIEFTLKLDLIFVTRLKEFADFEKECDGFVDVCVTLCDEYFGEVDFRV